MIGAASTLFRAFSATDLQLFAPGPMAQAFTFRAFGAEIQSFHTLAVAGGFVLIETWRSVMVFGQAKRITKPDEMVTALQLIFERNPTLTLAINQTKIGAWIRSNHIVVYRVRPHAIHGRKSIGEEA